MTVLAVLKSSRNSGGSLELSLVKGYLLIIRYLAKGQKQEVFATNVAAANKQTLLLRTLGWQHC